MSISKEEEAKLIKTAMWIREETKKNTPKIDDKVREEIMLEYFASEDDDLFHE